MIYYQSEYFNSTYGEGITNFLKQHEDYTLFLQSNYETYGPTLSESPYSGNYKIIRDPEGSIIGVYCLTKKGSLLIESLVAEPIFELVLSCCQEEQIPIRGVVGRWELCKPLWEHLKNKHLIEKETFHSKEILYSLNLSTLIAAAHPNVRLLAQEDFSQWKILRLAYLLESGLENTLTKIELFQEFLKKVNQRIVWGYFLEEKLVSIADLNAKTKDLGQVGGVYTDPPFRQKGYSKAVLRTLSLECKRDHSLRKLIIFTGETNFSAQKIYLSLGASHIGHFALFFGTPNNIGAGPDITQALS